MSLPSHQDRETQRARLGFGRRPHSQRRGAREGAVLFLLCAGLVVMIAGPKFAADYQSSEIQLPALPFKGQASVVDGDTLDIRDRHVRLWGIDAPELATPAGKIAAEYLAQVIGNQEVTCFDTGQRSQKRIVARCADTWGRDLAEIMVASGWALDWPEFSRGSYAAAEVRARAAKQGVFSAPTSVEPPIALIES